jgi:hypothetical protein
MRPWLNFNFLRLRAIGGTGDQVPNRTWRIVGMCVITAKCFICSSLDCTILHRPGLLPGLRSRMADLVTEMLNKWVHSTRRTVKIDCNALVDDLLSDDEETRQTSHVVLNRLGWLEPQPELLPREERQRRIEEALEGMGLSPAQCRASAVRASRSTGRKAGRPRTKGDIATRALMLRLVTDKTWRQIATAITPRCEHFCLECGDTLREPDRVKKKRCPKCNSTIRPEVRRQKVCDRCVGAVRELAEHLKSSLCNKGLYPAPPCCKVFDSIFPFLPRN